MSSAEQIVSRLLEVEEPDPDFSMDYVKRAGNWNRVDLIPQLEWRALYKNLGFKVAYLRRHLKEAYGYITITLKPKDGHTVDWQDETLVKDYTYEFLERRLGVERRSLPFMVTVWAMSGVYEGQPYNEIGITLRKPDKEFYRQYGGPRYDEFYMESL